MVSNSIIAGETIGAPEYGQMEPSDRGFSGWKKLVQGA
jgi:hypothetical protein